MKSDIEIKNAIEIRIGKDMEIKIRYK